MPGGTLIPYHAERFGSTSHIAPSIPVVEFTSHIPPGSRVSDPIRILDLKRVTIGNSTYLITQIPSSSIPSSSNVHPPPHSRGPSGRNVATSYVCTTVTRLVVSQLHIPLVVSGGHAHTSRGHIPTSEMYIPTSGTYVPTYGVYHGTSHVMTYVPYYGTQYGQGSSPYGGGYQQPAYSPNSGFVALNSQGTPPMVLPCHPIWVKWEEGTMAKAMVVIRPM